MEKYVISWLLKGKSFKISFDIFIAISREISTWIMKELMCAFFKIIPKYKHCWERGDIKMLYNILSKIMKITHLHHPICTSKRKK